MIQLYPGDCDYFERVNIIAEMREEACRILADLMRDKALDKFEGPGYQLIQVRFGTWKTDVVKDGERITAGSPISWDPDEVKAGKMQVFRASSEPWGVAWEYSCLDPGWCKMDWVIAEPEKGRVVNASNMLDVTWEAPDGSITPQRVQTKGRVQRSGFRSPLTNSFQQNPVGRMIPSHCSLYPSRCPVPHHQHNASY